MWGLSRAVVSLLSFFALVGLMSVSASIFAAERQSLYGYYEPSGVTQLDDGRILIVEDEKSVPISLLVAKGAQGFAGEPLRMAANIDMLFGKSIVGKLDDMEAVTLGSDGYVYAITSHSRTARGNRFKKREKLIRFKVDGNRAVDVGVIKSLRDQITALNRHLADAGDIVNASDDDHFSIEGMAYDKAENRLLIGLRGPLVDKQAVIVVLPDPQSAFEKKTSDNLINNKVIYLDLDGGGIRALAFAPELDGFLIISRKQKKGAAFKLWLWSANDEQSPRRIRIEKKFNLKKAEGVTPVRHHGVEKIMLVFDSGHKFRGNYADFVLLSYDELKIEAAK